MKTIELKVVPRETRGKGPAKRLRAEGACPAVVYGVGIQPAAVTVPVEEMKKFNEAIGHNVFVKLDGEGELSGKMSLIYDWQREAIKGNVLHADLMVIDMNKALTIEIPLELLGTAKGVKEGGIVNQTRREIEVECLPNAIPEKVTVDVSEMEIGDSVHIEDIALPEGVRAVYDNNYTLVTVNAPVIEEEPEPVEELEGLEGEEGEGAAAAEGEGGEGGAEGEKSAESEGESKE